jgi:hypothetical protein
MSDTNVNTADKINKKVRRKRMENVPMVKQEQALVKSEEQKTLQDFFDADKIREDERKKFFKILCTIIIASAVAIVLTTSLFIGTMLGMKNDYLKSEREIILSKEMVKAANDWERLPEKEQKEKLRGRFNEIFKYYNLKTKVAEKITDTNTILDLFNTVYDCTKVSGVNFFLPIAYMKVITNFNPNYNKNNKLGIASMYLKEAEYVSGLSLVKNNSAFNLTFKGVDTLKNPIDSTKILIARLKDLNEVFRGRVEWVILALLTNEYEVIDRYWNNGSGEIPEDKLRSGELKQILDYYYAFKDWQIIPAE